MPRSQRDSSMIGNSTKTGIRRSRPYMLCMAATLLGTPYATAQQTDPLEQQLQELKQEYTATTQALELRMAALELQIEKQKQASEKTKEATVSIVDLAAAKAAQQVVVERSHEVGAATFQGDLSSEPTY